MFLVFGIAFEVICVGGVLVQIRRIGQYLKFIDWILGAL